MKNITVNKKPVVIIGAGGFGREVLDVIDAVNQVKPQYEVLGYVVDSQYGAPGTIVNDCPILGGYDWLENRHKDVLVICGVGPTHHRLQLIRRAETIGCTFFSAIHPNALLTKWVKIGVGVVITAGSILTNQIHIGNHVHVNLDCTIGHDVIIDDFVTLSPGVHISGNVRIKEGAYIGTGANTIEKLTIGEWSTVGAGSTIVKDVPSNTTVVGVPGKVIKTKENNWHLK